jgi:coenzyme F420-dependent glucose-6-phosphate dehydrogenase
MARIGFHASHEQFPPSELLALVQAAEAAGFDSGMSSDHFRPAIIAQGAATLAEMFPNRFWLALGSGQRLNEDIAGLPWPKRQAARVHRTRLRRTSVAPGRGQSARIY